MRAERHFSIHPRLATMGFANALSLLDLPGDIVSGHPDRHVVRVRLGDGTRRFTAFLKREHRVRWRDRLDNWLAGFGLSSNSLREARMLRELRQAGIPVPRVLACGEHRGRAFLLVRALTGYRDLLDVLHGYGSRIQRVRLARRLGQLLARVHDAGFEMPDLLSKHVLVQRRTMRLALIDWQRARRRSWVRRSVCLRDFALLHASVPPALAAPRERLACLSAYFRARSADVGAGRSTAEWATLIGRLAERVANRRAVREAHRPRRPSVNQRLRWLNADESLCVTREFWIRSGEQIPDWLRSAASDCPDHARVVTLRWQGFRVRLQQSPPLGWLQRCMARLRGRRVVARAVRDAGLLFRLERFGVPVPKLQAFGQRDDGGGFLLTRPLHDSTPIKDWLDTRQLLHRRVLRRLGKLLCRVHESGCALEGKANGLQVQGESARVVMADVGPVQIRLLRTDAARARDVRALLNALGLTKLPGDAELVVRGYLGKRPDTAASQQLTRAILA